MIPVNSRKHAIRLHIFADGTTKHGYNGIVDLLQRDFGEQPENIG